MILAIEMMAVSADIIQKVCQPVKIVPGKQIAPSRALTRELVLLWR